jgi:HD-GYP domain-containing protein (c-di-GMP phosphodiesterase class II)
MSQTLPADSTRLNSPLERLYPIGLDSLHADLSAPCDLFRQLQDGRIVLFAREGVPFEAKARYKLYAHGVSELFIREEEISQFFGYIRETLTKIVRDPRTSSLKKAKAVHVSCRETMKRAFDEPRGSFLRQAHEVINPTVDLIVHDDNATRCLIKLTAYDHCTYVHSTNVGIFGVALARILYGSSSKHDMNRLGAGFFLHDLGKCRIPIEILNKPGVLDDKERQIVNRHPQDGYQMLKEGGFLTDEAEILTLQHHERDDGKGYPLGLRKDDIHPYARICRIVDVYEALTAERPYHQRRSTFEALKFMQEKLMTDLDQQIMSNFLSLFSG